jgi:DNA-binding winged helix-turn-helix (wHTH) protein
MAPPPEDRPAEVRLFAPFRLDIRDERLWKGPQELKIRRKPFTILKYLTAHPLVLVTQEELVEIVWGEIAVSQSLLRTHVGELRRLLGEGIIETVAGRGYRFVRSVEVEKPETSRQFKPGAAPAATFNLIGRRAEMDVLKQVFDAVLDQKRQVVFVTGEPGIGKTSLVDAFLQEIVAPLGAVAAAGTCVEQFGTGEAYLPVFGALGALCRGPDSGHIVELLARHAPTWLVQMPGLVADEKLRELHLRVQGATQARMLREFAEWFDILASERPAVLVIEDLQWSDRSTIDLVAMLGTRRETARALVIATCRPAELAKVEGLAKIITELSAREQALVLELESWSKDAVVEHLAQRFGNHRFPDQLASTVQEMTGGNPLFCRAVVDDLVSRRMVQQVGAWWHLAASVAEVANRRPETIRQLIGLQIDRLKLIEQRVIEAASLVGLQFTSGIVACALELPPDEVDSVCETLAKEWRLLRFVTSESLPDGTIQLCYAFVHALYRDAVLRRIPSATNRIWHRKIAEGLEATYGESSEAIAAELAIHFDEAHDAKKAIRYHCVAGERAMRRSGRADALAHFNRARALVAKLPVSDETDRIELAVLKYVGPAVMATHGFQDPLLQQTCARTAELARRLGNDRILLAALLGLQRCHFLRGELRNIELYESEVAKIVSRLGDPVLAAEATVLSASARLFRGQLAAARGPLLVASQVLDGARRDTDRLANAPVVGVSGGYVVVLAWLDGALDEAITLAREMGARAEALRDPFQQTVALTMTALVHMWRREPDRTFAAAQQALGLARDAGALVWQGRAMSLYHWAATTLDPRSAGEHFDALSTGLAGPLGAGPYGQTAFTPCLVEVAAQAGRPDRALQLLDDALAFVEVSDERAWSSELHRLRGQITAERDPAQAEREIRTGLEIARRQGAKSFVLRAALSLAKLDLGPEKHRAAMTELQSLFETFTEGLEAGDLVEARAVLEGGRISAQS